MPNEKLKLSFNDLRMALSHYTGIKKDTILENIGYLALIKAYELALEYFWKDVKRCVEAEGLEVVSPKAALREGIRLGLIENNPNWFRYIDARNISAHDYYGISKEGFLSLVTDFTAYLEKYLNKT